MELSSQQRKALEAQANAMDPVVRIGKFGIGPTLIKSVADALAARELIKIKLLETADIESPQAAAELAAATGAAVVRVIGRVIILFRENPEKQEKPVAPVTPAKAAVRRKPGKKAGPAKRSPRRAPSATSPGRKTPRRR